MADQNETVLFFCEYFCQTNLYSWHLLTNSMEAYLWYNYLDGEKKNTSKIEIIQCVKVPVPFVLLSKLLYSILIWHIDYSLTTFKYRYWFPELQFWPLSHPFPLFYILNQDSMGIRMSLLRDFYFMTALMLEYESW